MQADTQAGVQTYMQPNTHTYIHAYIKTHTGRGRGWYTASQPGIHSYINMADGVTTRPEHWLPG